jgi:hypothetical protein
MRAIGGGSLPTVTSESHSTRGLPGRVCWRVFGVGLVCLAIAVPAVADGSEPLIHREDNRVRILDYAFGPNGGVVGLEGEVLRDQWLRCTYDREVQIYRAEPGGAVRLATVFTATGNDGFVWNIGERPPPGKYFARIRRDVRYQNFRGERHKLICRRDTSNTFTVTPE